MIFELKLKIIGKLIDVTEDRCSRLHEFFLDKYEKELEKIELPAWMTCPKREEQQLKEIHERYEWYKNKYGSS